MGKIYMEVVTSKYMSGTSMRDESSDYILLDIDIADIPEHFSSAESFAETNNCILEAIKKYSEENDIMLGIEYNNAMVGTNMYQDQKYSTSVFVEINGYFRKLFIEYTPVIKSSIYLNWLVSLNKWEYRTDCNSFCVVKRESSF